METNCNELSAMQRKDCFSGNMKCNCSENTNTSKGNRNCSSGCGKFQNCSRNMCCGRSESQGRNMSCRREENRNGNMSCRREENRSGNMGCRGDKDRNENMDCRKEESFSEKVCCNGNRHEQTGSMECGKKRQVCDHVGRSMDVECVCEGMKEKKCPIDDPMEKLGCRYPIAMAYVPWQQWGELYDAEYGLIQGTIFKDLNKIFCGVRCF